MKVDWSLTLTLFVAIVLASLFEHMVLAPRMKQSPGKTLPSTTAVPRTLSEYISLNHPGAYTV